MCLGIPQPLFFPKQIKQIKVQPWSTIPIIIFGGIYMYGYVHMYRKRTSFLFSSFSTRMLYSHFS